jgi:hypothetical protein
MQFEFDNRNPQRSIGPQANPDNYFTGKPCRTCGCTIRLKSNNACVPCKGEQARQYYQKNRTKILMGFKAKEEDNNVQAKNAHA